MAILEGSLERITYHNADTGYTVARVQPVGKRYLVAVVGKLLGVQVGESLRLEGEWASHPEHGKQFNVVGWQAMLPADVEGIRKYLGSGLIKGIGPKTAERIVDTFGVDTLRVIEQQPERLREVSGLGRKKIDDITRAWHEQQGIKALMTLLQSHNITPSLAIRIYRHYAEQALTIVQDHPYRLADEVFGIGFLTADEIAQAQGVPYDDAFRIGAGIRHVLSEAANDGHCYLPRDELLPRAARILQVDEAAVLATLQNIDAAGEVHVDDVDGVPAIYLLPFYRAELGVANSIRIIQSTPSPLLQQSRRMDWARLWDQLAAESGFRLTEKQQAAVKAALSTKLLVLTGGPGTGKTSTMRAIIVLLEKLNKRYVLASPTGRAAKRLSEATGAEAKTIHRLLEYSPIGGGGQQFKRDRDNPLPCDMLVVDEASMLDVLLCNSLLKAVPPSAHVLFVGDVDQLPSVGPGNVLHDLIESWAVTTVQLDRVFRQAEGSGIITNAHRINHGEQPQLRGLDDFFFFPRPQPDACAELVVDLVCNRIPRRFGCDPRRAIQVLSPMHRGPAGVQSLNKLLQEALNPPHPTKTERTWGETIFRLGDRVMQVRNNYDLDVYNGDVGEIVSIDRDDQKLTVRFEEARGAREVSYDWAYLDELQLAYALSIHKSQGGEYPVVVVPLLRQHFVLLQRNLLYTAITRAKHTVVLVGDQQAIEIAVENNRVAQRYTGLQRRLRV
ncbi:MAG TPA: ATP-dependent RecD-like DNA helicase [Herpetosiphonaceae bacterium]